MLLQAVLCGGPGLCWVDALCIVGSSCGWKGESISPERYVDGSLPFFCLFSALQLRIDSEEDTVLATDSAVSFVLEELC